MKKWTAIRVIAILCLLAFFLGCSNLSGCGGPGGGCGGGGMF